MAHAGASPHLIDSAFGCYQLHLGSGTLDLDVAVDALHTAQTRLARGDAQAAVADATLACLIFRRPFLSGLYSPWTLAQRDRVNDLHVSARQCLAEAHARGGEFADSARNAERALGLDPYREELGVQPAPETVAVFREALEARG